MGAHFCAAHAQASIQRYFGRGTVWLTTAGTEQAITDEVELSRPAGAGGEGPFDIGAQAGVLARTQTVTLALAAGSFPSLSSEYSRIRFGAT